MYKITTTHSKTPGFLTLVLGVLILMSCNAKVEYEIAFASDRGDDTDIFITSTDDTTVVNLTDTDVTEYNFTWSADGNIIYYTSYEPEGRKIKSIEVQTKSVNIILEDSTVQSLSDVSINGSDLIIATKEHHSKGELYIYNTKTGSKTRMTNNVLYEAGAKYSPDETMIVASIQTKAGDSINHSGIAEIFAIKINDLTTTQLTDLKGFNALPDYSPDGKSIAFHHCDAGICDVYVMNADGTNPVNLTKGQDDNRWPRWSPDGKWIAFTKTIDNNSDIYFISPDGSVIKPVIDGPVRDEIAEFNPAYNGK